MQKIENQQCYITFLFKTGKSLINYNFNIWKFLVNIKHIQEETKKYYYPDKAVIKSVKPPITTYQICITSQERAENIVSIYANYREQN